jgi:hypothetical protein
MGRLSIKSSITSMRNLFALALPIILLCPHHFAVRRVCESLLDAWPRLGGYIQLGEFGSNEEYVDARGIEDLLGRRNRCSEVRVLGQPRDEEHEAACFDLHFGKVCNIGREIGVFAAISSVQLLRKGGVC